METPWETSLTVYGRHDCAGDRLQFLLSHKEVPIRFIDPGDPCDWPQHLRRVNPDLILPCIVDKNLFTHGQAVIDEYINERFPCPQVLPFEPKDRAMARFLVQQIINLYEWRDTQDLDVLWEALWSASPWFMGEDFTIVDITVAPVFSRYNKPLPLHVEQYKERLLKKLLACEIKQTLKECA